VRNIILLLSLFLLINCNREGLRSPQHYVLSIPEVRMTTNYADEGTAYQRINTVWVYVNDRPLGTFDLPADIHFTTDPGEAEVTMIAGVSQNGINALRVEYPFFRTYRENIVFAPEQKTYFLNAANDSIPVVQYLSNANIFPVEDFENIGLSLQATGRSEVPLRRTPANDPNVFKSNIPGEPNQYSGYIQMSEGETLFEFETVQEFSFPIGGSPVYAELNFKTNHPFSIGVISNTTGGIVQSGIVEVQPTHAGWRKIYVYYTDDVSNTPGIINSRLFIGGIRQDADKDKDIRIYFDNLKVIF
jgi:hypothetical protein